MPSRRSPLFAHPVRHVQVSCIAGISDTFGSSLVFVCLARTSSDQEKVSIWGLRPGSLGATVVVSNFQEEHKRRRSYAIRRSLRLLASF